MAGFKLCEECQQEYRNPLDRRFHAQPVACDKCGPQLTFRSSNSAELNREQALQAARLFIKEDKIIAVKGLGGFHIVCNAMNKSTVETLINRKRRSEKPLALMAFDLETIKKYCEVSSEEAKLLDSPEHPIVLLKKKSNINLPGNIATNQNTLGFMLPYTPLHLLLLEPEEDYPEVLVMTSGNLSEEPIAYADQDAEERLSSIVDGFLTHDREINIRVDDSVARVFNTKPYLIRRSRGLSPRPIKLPFELPEILACGAELKNTFCLSKSNYAFLSHHIGDLENNETLESFESGIEYYKRLFRVNPKFVAADLHPDYLSTRYAIDLSKREKISLTQVQHHHAHLASCLADNGWESEVPVIGVIFDGTGYGIDGTIWGGEFLVGSYKGFTRQLHLIPTPLPGGDSATKNPAKIGLTYLFQAGINLDDDLLSVEYFTKAQRSTLISQIENHMNTPMTSSMGRLFDAVSSIIGIRQEVTYEAQAAIELENICAPDVKEIYEIEIIDETINFLPMIQSIVDDFHTGLNKGIISAKFHNAIAYMSLQACRQIRLSTGVSQVALSGGVWQNMTLLGKTLPLLSQDRFRVMTHHQVPANDGGVSLGQLLIAAKSFTN
jgi:hydrogenase maturation protein HypF